MVDTSLQASLHFPGLPAPQFTRPEAFNGIGPNDNESSSFVIQVDSSQHFAPPIPEPETYIMFLTGLGLLSLVSVRARRAAPRIMC
ncbi:MAG: PEP-CTERM sorting domain-containing protein [Nitrosospira sp.]|nr:PEP-CTERM sorting domain-containing protein [Nitrosospira sp.]